MFHIATQRPMGAEIRTETAPTASTRGWVVIVCVGLLSGPTLLVYGPAIGHGFLHWDDNLNITENRYLNPVSWSTLARFWRAPYEGMYVPVTYSWFAAEAVLAARTGEITQRGARLDPRVFHLGNLLLHTACVVLVFVLLWRLVENAPAACAGALFFSLHPLHVENVAWVTESKGLLSGLFSLLAILGYLRYSKECSSSTQSDPKHASTHLVLATVAYVLALLAKPSAAGVPLVAFVLDWGWHRRSVRGTLPVLFGWALIAVAVAWVTKGQQQDAIMVYVPRVWLRPVVALDALAFYLYKLVIPWPLSPDYCRSPKVVLNSWWGYVTPLVPCALVLLLWRLRERRVWLSAIGVFVAALAPVLGLVTFGYQDISTVADRYAYLAITGPALALAWFVSQRLTPSRVVIVLVWVTVCGVLSWRQVKVWRDDLSLFTHGLKVAPRSYIVHSHLGAALLERRDFDGAISHFRQALRLKPAYVRAHVNLALVYLRQNKPAAAVGPLEQAVHIEPRRAKSQRLLGVALASSGRAGDAVAHLRRSLAIDPRQATVHRLLGAIYERQGKFDDAAREYRRAIELKPHWNDVREWLERVVHLRDAETRRREENSPQRRGDAE